MYDDAELDTTFSERARGAWVSRTAHSSSPNNLEPCLRDVRDGRRKTSVLVLTEELESKIQTALALGCGHRSALQDVKRWKRELLLQQADNTGSLEAMKHRLSVKRLEIAPGKEPTEWQKKSLENLAQSVERLRANRNVFEGNIAKLDRDLERGLNRWRKAWTDVDKILVKVWRDAGRLLSDDDSDADSDNDKEEPKNESGSKSKDEGKRTPSGNNGNEDRPLVLSDPDSTRQRQAGGQQNDVSAWQSSVESALQGSDVGAQNPGSRDETRRGRMHHRQPASRRHQDKGKSGFLNRLGDVVAGIHDQRAGPHSSDSRVHRSNYNSPRARRYQYPGLRKDEPPSPTNSKHRHEGGENSSNRYRERHRNSRSQNPRRDRNASRDAPRDRDRGSHDKEQSRVHDRSPLIRSRDSSEDDRGGFRYRAREEQHR